MAKKSKIATDLGHLDENKFYTACMLIVNSITLYLADFGFLTVPITDLAAEMVIYNKALTAVEYPSKASDIKQSRIRAQKILTKDGNDINDEADGNLSLLKKSGYPMQKESEGQGVLEQTELDMNATDVAGELEYSISYLGIQGIRYGIMITAADNPDNNPANWTFFYCSQRDGIIPGLISKKDYKCCSFGMGTEQKLTYSEPFIIAPK